MFRRFLVWIQGVISKMLLRANDAKAALKVDIAISPTMQEAIDLWGQMFQDKAPWLNTTTKSLGIAAAIAGEIARLTTVELETEVTGDARGKYLQEEYKRVILNLRRNVEKAAAGGGMVFKPYPDGDHLAVDCVPAWRFMPTSFNSKDEVTGAVFVERVTRGKVYFTRMEHHQMTNTGYIIRNLAFQSDNEAALGHPCPLGMVDEWAALEPEAVIAYNDGTPPEGMLFSYFRIPWANNVDPESPLGVSVYARATDLIQEADKQYSRILWEYEGSELAVDAGIGALQNFDADGKPVKMPERNKRLFRQLPIDRGTSGDLYEVFSPTIRDTSLFNGLNNILKRVEFNCNLAYGTISDPQNVDKTAEEIKTSKQRSYSAVSDVQTALQGALEHLVWIMDFYATLYKLAPAGKYEVGFTWGDGILQDIDKEYTRRKALADDGWIRPEAFLAWYFGVSEEEALKMMPEQAEPMFPEGGEE